ncbi:ap2-like ethylene-responsive transcription factor ail6 [Phtheirospermum japonicum]|uniref:Ap2-like ethylene-responsive transcription factor ail6 n=1 Tax=Phtheirospermum japonicum TaxID=374723 RepID=A0A830B9L4_9LAMI|nr:ap2-like ethylene-responsive transcription factor ail6 [Phtheirospermum japonicum]
MLISVSSFSLPYYSFADNFFATGWPNQKAEAMYNIQSESQEMKEQNSSSIFTVYVQQPPNGGSTEVQDSSLTNMYFGSSEQQDLKNIIGFPAFSPNSGLEVDDSGFAGQTRSPVESAAQLVAHSHCPITTAADAATTANGLSLGNINININSNIHQAIVVSADSESCKKIGDTYGQRTSIFRGVTRHRWTGRYEAHLWDNSCRREGQARKGRQGGYDKEAKAARAYDLAALKYWGPTATTNFSITNYAKEVGEMKNATKQEFIASLRRKSSGFSRGASIYRGVTRHHQQGRWQARIGHVAGNKDLYLGTFATEEEAAEAYDIAAIKFRGVNAVTNFEMSRYDIEAIAESPRTIGGTAKRLKLSLEAEEDNKLHPSATILQTSCSSNSSGSNGFTAIQPPPPSAAVPCGVPLERSAPIYHHNLFHHLYNSAASDVSTPMTFMPPLGEFFIWPHQSY